MFPLGNVKNTRIQWNSVHNRIEIGDHVEIYPSNLDMSTNVYHWPIMGRSRASQR